MSSSRKLAASIRSWIAKPLIFFMTAYVIALTCSMSVMEIGSWTSVFFFLLFVLFDRMNKTRQLEFHTLGVELPILILIITVIFGLRINAPEGDFVFALGSLRNLVLLFTFTYALQVYRNLNRIFAILAVCATLTSVYAIWQHFSGIDIVRHDHRALMQVPWGNAEGYASVGWFSHHLTYGHSYMMLLCIPWAALLLSRRPRWWQLSLYIISFGLILTSLIYSYGRGVWIAVLVSLPIMAFFASRKLFLITVGILFGVIAIFYYRDPLFKDRAMSILAEKYQSNDERKQLWQINMEMFHDHPWIGVGYRQNEPRSEEYYKKLGIQDGMAGHAHSNYIELLATTGIIGFTCYMLFILAYVLMTARLYSMIPVTHYWHRVFALSALGAQLAFHVGGLTQWNFGDAEVQHQFLFWLAIVGYMSRRYYVHIVPDDRSL